MNFFGVALGIGAAFLCWVGLIALLNCLERFEVFRRILNWDVCVPGCRPSRDEIRQQWNKVASLVDKCNNLHAIRARAGQLWKVVERQGTFPVHMADSSVTAESLGRLRSSLIASAEVGRKLCHKHLEKGKPSAEVISLNTLFSLVVDACQRCSPEAPCGLSELKKSSGGW